MPDNCRRKLEGKSTRKEFSDSEILKCLKTEKCLKNTFLKLYRIIQ